MTEGSKLHLDDPGIQVLCEDCGSEVFCCNYTKKTLIGLYGKVLCRYCRDKYDEINPNPELSNINKRLEEAYQLISELKHEKQRILDDLRNSVKQEEDCQLDDNPLVK